MSRRDLGLMLALAAIWGLSFPLLRLASPVVGPVVVAGFRVTGGALVLSAWMAAQGGTLPLRRHLAPLLLTALMSAVLPFMGLSYAARQLPAGMLAILNATTPLWGALVAWVWAGERLNWRQALNVVLGFLGVAALVSSRDPSLGTGPASSLPPLAVALALASTLMYALAVHQNKRQLADLPPLTNSWGTLVAASALLLGPALWTGPWPDATHGGGAWPPAGLAWAAVPWLVWGALAALATLCTGLAYVWFYALLERVGPTKVLMVTYLIPVFGMAWGALFFGEQITPRMVWSAVLIVGSTVWAQRGNAR